MEMKHTDLRLVWIAWHQPDDAELNRAANKRINVGHMSEAGVAQTMLLPSGLLQQKHG